MRSFYAIFRLNLLISLRSRSLVLMLALILILSAIMLSQLAAEFNTLLRQQAAMQLEMSYYETVAIPYLQLLSALFLVITPLILMRTISAEREQGTLELLLTFPIRSYWIVLGKWLSGVVIVSVLLIFSLLPLFFVTKMSEQELLPLCASAIGLILQIFLNVSVILFFSSFLKDSISIAGISFVFMYGLFLFERYSSFVSAELKQLSFQLQLAPFFQGAITLTGILYFISYAGFFLIAAGRLLATRRES
jgi:ABC-2 type transport system permease protein